MEECVRVRYENTDEDIVAFNRFHVDKLAHVQRARHLWTWVLPGVLLIAAAVSDLVQNRIEWLPHAVLSGVLYVIFFRWVYRRSLERSIAKACGEGQNAAVLCEHVLEVLPDALVERTPVSESRIAWSAVERVEVTETHTFVYTQGHSAHVVPRDSLKEGDYDGFRRAVQRAMDARGSASSGGAARGGRGVLA